MTRTLACRDVSTTSSSNASRMRLGDLLLLALPFLPFLSSGITMKWLGLTSFLLVTIIFTTALFKINRIKSSGSAHIPLLFLMLIGLFSTNSINPQVFVQIIQIFLLVLVIRMGSTLGYTKKSAHLAGITCIFLVIIALIDFLSGAYVLAANPNLYGIFGFCWGGMFLKIHSRILDYPILNKRILLIFLPIFLVLVSGGRASLVAISAMALWIFICKYIAGSRLQKNLALVLTIIPILIIFNINSGIFEIARNAMPFTGGKTTFSGRDVIWENIFNAVSTNNYVGFGLGSTPGNIKADENKGLSAHNGFMQIFYQFGVAGLVAYILTYMLLITVVQKRVDGGVSTSILLGAMVLEMFEVVMTQNHFGAGFFLWILIVLNSPPTPSKIATLIKDKNDNCIIG